MLLLSGGEHSNSLQKQFVFVNEVLNKISGVFQSANKTMLCPSDYAPKYFPEKYPDLQLQT